jgi:hypothetical protein
MKYYQEGLDFKPKTISQDGSDIPVDPMGYWNPENVGSPVIIPSNVITMEGVDQPLLGISDTGDVQYMEPGEDYEFDGEYVTEYPVAQNGTATRADSIILLKNAMLKNAFYKNDPNYVKINPTVNFKNPQVLKSLAQASVNAKRRYSSAFPDDSYKILPARDSKEFIITAGDIKRRVGKVAGSSDVYSAPDILYENDIDTYFNPASPPVFFSPSILPQGSVMYNSSAESGHGDISSSPYYDPIAVSPWDMLTPQQQKVRLQTYGTSGTPYSKPSKQLPTPSTKPKPTSKPVAAKPAPKPTVTPQKDKKIITGGKKPVVYRPEPEVEYKPRPKVEAELPRTVTGNMSYDLPTPKKPGSSKLAKYTSDTPTKYSFTYPTGKYLEDETIYFPTKEAWKSFVEKIKGTERFKGSEERQGYAKATGYLKDGGNINDADAQPLNKLDQLLNFTNYNKPTKGGWLDKYN